MKKSDFFQKEQQKFRFQETAGLDPRAVFALIVKNWYWFVIVTITTLFCARLYVNHTMPVFQTSATILINETENGPMMDNSQLLQGLGLPGGMQNLENQIMILRSRDLIEKTLQALPFEIEYYIKTFRNRLPMYPEAPINIVFDRVISLPNDVEFSVKYQGNNMFLISSLSDNFSFQKTASFGDVISLPGGNFSVECNNEAWFSIDGNEEIYFIIYSPIRLLRSFSNRFSVERLSRDGSILRISMVGTNRIQDADFLNRHIEGFQAISLDKKNTEAQRRIQFIDDQLVGISDSLLTTENRLQQFRSSHKVMDLSAQGQSIIGQVTLLENERARLSLEANYYDYLADYLSKDISDVPIVPITMGITDPGLTRLVEELAELQGQISTKGAGELNPLQRNLEQRIRTTKAALKETLNGLRRANSLARSENQDQINKANAQASALPMTERQLLGIERKFQLNNELYTFLLETRAELEMQKASNRADSEVIDPADERFSVLISPDRTKIYFVGLLAGVGMPLLIILLNILFSKKVKDEDIRKMTDFPVVGNLSHSSDRTNLVVLNNPNSAVAEAYRLLRSRMQFFTKDAAAPVILVTSSIPGEGKTFTAINLASVYSLLGKKTILVGFDLRKPKIYEDFKLSNEKGVSTWLIGKDRLQDIIQVTTFENLSVITAGPVPPNPSELTALGKTKELLSVLKEKYECIVIDSSPIGVVSDTFYLASLADATLLVIRPGHSLRDMLELSLNEIKTSGTKNVGLIINDIVSDKKHYGNREAYGYVNEKKSKRFFIFKKV